MNKIPTYIKLIVFALLILCTVIDIRLKHNSWNNTVDQFIKTLHYKEDLIEDYFNNRINFTTENEKLISHKTKGITYLAFKEDSLIYWSDNTINIDYNTINKLKHSKYGKIGHGDYIIKKRIKKDTTLYGLILVKSEYEYNNKYLSSSFNPDFNLCNHIIISKDLKNHKDWIKNKNGDTLFAIYSTDKNHKYKPHILLKWGFIIFFLLLFVIIYNAILGESGKKRAIYLIFTIIGLIIARWIMISFGLPNTFYSLDIFSNKILETRLLKLSLGDLLLNSIFLFFILYLLINIPFKFEKTLKNKILLSSIYSLAVLIFNLFAFSLLKALSYIINNTDIAFNLSRWKDIDICSYLTYFMFLLLFYVFTLAVSRHIQFFKEKIKLKRQFIYILIGSIIFIAITSENPFIAHPALIIVLATFLTGIYTEYAVKSELKYSSFLFILFILSFILIFIISNTTKIKENVIRQNYALKLFNERDNKLEEVLPNISDYITTSPEIKQLIKKPYENEAIIERNLSQFSYDYIKDNYELQLTICGETDSLMIEPDTVLSNCFEFFGQTLKDKGEKIGNSYFHFINNFDGLISYIAEIPYKSEGKSLKIFLQINSKTGDEGKGYPELLKSEKTTNSRSTEKYSWGKYKNGFLIASSGKFNYMTSCKGFEEKEEDFFVKDGYSHHIHMKNGDMIIVSLPAESITEILLNLPYIFGLFCLIAFIMWIIHSFPFRKTQYISFKTRIRTAFIIMLVGFFFIIGGLSIYYNSTRFKDRHYERIAQLMKLVTRELEFTEPHANKNPEITNKLRSISDMTFADINIYDLKGRLISTSRPEIFSKKIISNLINPRALHRFQTESLSYLIQKENIGSLSYLSAYIPMTDTNNKIIAYINVPYFSENAALTEEIGNLIITGVNINVLMILIAVFISVIISDKITLPLSLVYNKLKDMKFGGMYEKIDYEQNDEIGRLVKEYNTMTDKLKESALNLAKSERETAWREMARQIAHEIKNPLTPMKLNIQHLQRSLKSGSPEWENQFQKTCNILMEQIDNMSAIANAFSDFAQMPRTRFQQINIVELLNNTIELFSKGKTTISKKENKKEIYVWADKEQLTRAFVNLLKNSIQATSDSADPKVDIDIFSGKEEVTVIIKDNGHGVPEEIKSKVFEPNFTTKSSGTGIGLAITKRIIENAKGSIWFTTKDKEGTNFFVSLPLYK